MGFRLPATIAFLVGVAGSQACGSSTQDRSVEPGPASTGSATPAPSATSTTPAPPSRSTVDASAPDTLPSGPDSDGDGLSDALEAKLAAEYAPYLSLHPSDGCKTHGVLVRIAPHPREKGRVMMWLDVLFQKDCGANGHVGDNEMSGIVIDPAKPAPAGILAVRSISHQNTACQRITTCGLCPGMTACTTAIRGGVALPVIFASKDKHGTYVDEATCDQSFVCDFGGCALSPSPSTAPIVNVGEPTKPLVTNLTTQGFVTAANGWTEPALMSFDPWKPGNFGGAGDVSRDLVDDAFVIDTAACK